MTLNCNQVVLNIRTWNDIMWSDLFHIKKNIPASNNHFRIHKISTKNVSLMFSVIKLNMTLTFFPTNICLLFLYSEHKTNMSQTISEL